MSLARSIPPWLWLILVALYFLSPVDIFPDFLGLPGRIDDFLVALAGLYFMYANSAKKRGSGGAASRSNAGDGRAGPGRGRAEAGEAPPEPGLRDPYEVLEVPRGTPLAEIRRRYRERLMQVHPDRVQHLGKEFQEMAEQKTRELTEAFRKIEQELSRNA